MRIALPATIAVDMVYGSGPGATTDLAGATMGTRWSVRLVLPRRMTAAAVQAAIQARLDGIVAEMSHWSPTSLLSRFNQLPAGQWMTLPPDFAQVMAAGLGIAEATGGAFDPAIGRLVNVRGFGPVGIEGQDARPAADMPPPGQGGPPIATDEAMAGVAPSIASRHWAPAFAGGVASGDGTDKRVNAADARGMLSCQTQRGIAPNSTERVGPFLPPGGSRGPVATVAVTARAASSSTSRDGAPAFAGGVAGGDGTDKSVNAADERIMSSWQPRRGIAPDDAKLVGPFLPPGEGRGPLATVTVTARAASSSTSRHWAPALAGVVGGGERATNDGATNPSDDAAIDAARAASGWRRLTFSAPDRRLRQPGGLALDLSGIAKGYAVDAVADMLGTMGAAHCLVEIGGELVGRGVQPGGMPWWVDLETPPGLDLTPIRIALHGLAVATSGDYRRGAHTIDPRTGRSTANRVVSVSVVAATALAADAWATALTVLGASDGSALATRHAIAARIVVATHDGACEWLSPALAAMIDDGAAD